MKKFAYIINTVFIRFIVILFISTVCLGLIACSVESDGFNEIKKARELFAGLDSAYVTVTDLKNGEIIQQFVFKYEKDFLTYYYMDSSKESEAKEIYYEHHDGYKLSYGYYGDNEWTEIVNGTSDFYYYDKTNKHPLADKGLIFFDSKNVVSSKVKKFQGAFQIENEYDVSKISTQFSEKLKSIGDLTEFKTTIVINTDGYAERILQTGVVDGNTLNIQIDVKSMNNVSIIERHLFPKKY